MPYHVTDVLGMLSDYGRVPNGRLEEAQRIGIETHRYSLSWIADPDMSFPSSDPTVSPYVDKVKDWFTANVEEAIVVEKPFHWKAMGFAGRIDLICRMRGDKQNSVVDLKRVYAVSKITALQTAAYMMGAAECLKIKVKRRFALHIPAEGPCKAVEFTTVGDWGGFMHALLLYRYLVSAGYVSPPKERN